MNGHLTDWFSITSGVRQGDLSPTFFACYINDLAEKINYSNTRFKVVGEALGILVYADDISLIAPTWEKAQKATQHLNCMVQMPINAKKLNRVEIR